MGKGEPRVNFTYPIDELGRIWNKFYLFRWWAGEASSPLAAASECTRATDTYSGTHYATEIRPNIIICTPVLTMELKEE